MIHASKLLLIFSKSSFPLKYPPLGSERKRYITVHNNAIEISYSPNTPDKNIHIPNL